MAEHADRGSSKKRAFATLVTKNYLAHARALAEGIRQFHDDPIYVLVLDGVDERIDPSREPFIVVDAADVLPPHYEDARFYYNAFELANAAKAHVHRYMLEHTDVEQWIYLDSDILVAGSLEPVFEALDRSPIVLTPHMVQEEQPTSAERLKLIEGASLKYGLFNGGFLGLARGESAKRFVEWFRARLDRLAFDCWQYVFTDQLWLNFVPLMFPEYCAFNHPGANVGFWNVHERLLEGDAKSGYRANGMPLLFLHLGHWSMVTREGPEVKRLQSARTREIFKELAKLYGERLLKHGYEECKRWKYPFGEFRDGKPITQAMRRHYWEMLQQGKWSEGSPFESAGYFRRFVWKRGAGKLVPTKIQPTAKRMWHNVRAMLPGTNK